MQYDKDAVMRILRASQDRLGDAEELLADVGGLVSLVLRLLEDPTNPVPLTEDGPEPPSAA